MSTKPTPRKAFAPVSEAPAEHPLDPTRREERSPLAEAPRVAFGTRLPADLAKAIKLAAVERDTTVQEAVEQAMRAWLAS
jgi:hypothetical protein